MKSVDDFVAVVRDQLQKSAQDKNVSLNDNIFSLILQGTSILLIEQQIKNKESGQSLEWHLVELIEAARKIHEEVHKCFDAFWRKQINKKIPPDIMKELELAVFSKNEAEYQEILKKRFNPRELFMIGNTLYKWLDNQEEKKQEIPETRDISSIGHSEIIQEQKSEVADIGDRLASRRQSYAPPRKETYQLFASQVPTRRPSIELPMVEKCELKANCKQHIYVLFKKLKTPEQVKLKVPGQKDTSFKGRWYTSIYALLEFILPAESSEYQFQVKSIAKSSPLKRLPGQIICFRTHLAFIEANSVGLQQMGPAEELCAASLLLPPPVFKQFIKNVDRDKIERNNTYISLLSLSDLPQIEELFGTREPVSQRQLCYLLASISDDFNPGEEPPRIIVNSLVSKLFLKCPMAIPPQTVDESLKEMDNCFRLTKLFVHFDTNQQCTSTKLFDSLLGMQAQKNLRRLISLLEEDNKQKRILKINSQRLLLTVKDSNTSGLIRLHMIVVAMVNRCWRENTNNAKNFAAQISMFNDRMRMVDQAVQDPKVSDAIKAQISLLDAFPLDWGSTSMKTIKQLHRGLITMTLEQRQLVVSAKLKSNIKQEICSQMRLTKSEDSVKFLSEIFVQLNLNPVLGPEDLEEPVKNLLGVKWTRVWIRSVPSVPNASLLVPFLSQVLFPLIISRPISNQSQERVKRVMEIIAQNITYNKLKFCQLLEFLSKALDSVSESIFLLKDSLEHLLKCLVSQSSQVTYCWRNILLRSQWVTIFDYHHTLLQDLFVQDLTNKLKAERTSNQVSDIEDSLYDCFFSEASARFNREKKASLVKGFFDLKVPIQKNEMIQILFRPQKIRAYCLLRKVADREVQEQILKVAGEVKANIDHYRIGRNQIRKLLSINEEQWKFFSELFDRAQGTSLQKIMENIEAKCKKVIIHLEQSIDFCDQQCYKLEDVASVRENCQKKLEELKQGDCNPIVLKLDPLAEQLLEVTKDLVLLRYLMNLPHLQPQGKLTVKQFCDIMQKEIRERSKDIERRDQAVQRGRMI